MNAIWFYKHAYSKREFAEQASIRFCKQTHTLPIMLAPPIVGTFRCALLRHRCCHLAPRLRRLDHSLPNEQSVRLCVDRLLSIRLPARDGVEIGHQALIPINFLKTMRG